jgi:hypothetical protein
MKGINPTSLMQNEMHPEFVGHFPDAVKTFFEVEDFLARFYVLLKDVTDCSGPQNENFTNQFWRRIIVRNVFALIEASSYGLKWMASVIGQKRNIEFSMAELTILREEKHQLKENGTARASGDSFQRFIPNLQFAFNCFAKANGSSLRLDVSKAPLKVFEKLRNRVTHPKHLGDLTITNEELKTASTVHNWYLVELLKLVEDVKSKMLQVSLSGHTQRVNQTGRIPVRKYYIVFQPNGDVYQFDTREEAERHIRCQMAINQPGAIPLLYHRDELC